MRVSQQITSQAPPGASCYRVEVPAKPGDKPGGRPVLVPMRTQREPSGPDFWSLDPLQLPVDIPEGTFRLRWYRLEGEPDEGEPDEGEPDDGVEAEGTAEVERKPRRRKKRYELVEVPPVDADVIPAVTIRFAVPVDPIPPPPVAPPPPAVPPSAPAAPFAPSEFADIEVLLRSVEGQEMADNASQIRTLLAFRRMVQISTNRELEVLHRTSELVHKAEQTAEQRIQGMADRGRALEDRMVQQTDRLMGIGEKFLSRVEAAADRVTAPPPAPPPPTDWGRVIEKSVEAAKEFGIAVISDEPHKALAALHGLEIPGIKEAKKDLPAAGAIPAAGASAPAPAPSPGPTPSPGPAPTPAPTASASPRPPLPRSALLLEQLPAEEAQHVRAILDDPAFELFLKNEAKEREAKRKAGIPLDEDAMGDAR